MAWRAAAGTALGNALNILAHAYFVALWSRRELIVGPGLVPDLLCGRWGVITRCGLPRWTDGAVSLEKRDLTDADWDVSSIDERGTPAADAVFAEVCALFDKF
mgnify:CR=1 FL=1